MHNALAHRWRSITAALASIAVMLGLVTAVAPSANAETMNKREYLQALVAHEKLSYDVFTRLALLHPRGSRPSANESRDDRRVTRFSAEPS